MPTNGPFNYSGTLSSTEQRHPNQKLHFSSSDAFFRPLQHSLRPLLEEKAVQTLYVGGFLSQPDVSGIETAIRPPSLSLNLPLLAFVCTFDLPA
jgi:hypothetical protein